jgi:hypothetical protein
MYDLMLVMPDGEEIPLGVHFDDFPTFDPTSEDHREMLVRLIEDWLEEYHG